MQWTDYRFECAQKLLGKGFTLVPIHPRGKRPLWNNWPNRGISDLESLRACLTANPDCNLGVLTGGLSACMCLILTHVTMAIRR